MQRNTPRGDVYSLIDEERNYQDLKWNSETTPSGGIHTVAEYVLYMQHQLDEARRVLSTQASPKAEQDGLDIIRKLAALAVVCMEDNGTVHRSK